jgi:Mg2+ and Co2+ transporter CorA|tara:strand:+ start:1749 stop:1931 length:183 start_codon:yes stop_codon:yes gene_type:complete
MIFNLKEAEFLSELTKPLVSMVDKLEEVSREVDNLKDLINNRVNEIMEKVKEFEEVMEND